VCDADHFLYDSQRINRLCAELVPVAIEVRMVEDAIRPNSRRRARDPLKRFTKLRLPTGDRLCGDDCVRTISG
jgi:hypothetical protein